jgi:hypothetical protein
MKHTKEILESIVRDSLSVAEVTRRLGLKNPNGGTQQYISKRIKKFGLDTSHFLGRRRNCGENHKGGCQKRHWTERLVNNRNGRKEQTEVLRRAMIESGIEHICDTCGILPIWNNEVLVLQISHKNGDSLDNRKENLHFECPNCHSQTEDFAGRSGRKNSPPLVKRQTHSAQDGAPLVA